ncbi:unnamed protein product [Sphagnum balticum]
MSDETASNGDDDPWNHHHAEAEDAEEAIYHREEELQVELQMTTIRLEELKRTLQQTKSIMGSVDGIPKAAVGKANAVDRVNLGHGAVPALVSDDDEDYYDDDYYEDEDSGQDVAVVQARNEDREVLKTPRRERAPVAALKRSPYEHLQDDPTPSGILTDRIQRIRQRCIDALGRDAFDRAYQYLRQNQT